MTASPSVEVQHGASLVLLLCWALVGLLGETAVPPLDCGNGCKCATYFVPRHRLKVRCEKLAARTRLPESGVEEEHATVDR